MPDFDKLQLPNKAIIISLALGLLSALAVVGINEMGYGRSAAAVARVTQYDQSRNALHALLQSMLDAETAHRGYLLTGDARDLEPYQRATRTLATQIESARHLFSETPEAAATLETLSGLLERKLLEMDAILRLRSRSSDGAWKPARETDAGNRLMTEIRALISNMIATSSSAIEQRREGIVRSLQLSRAGIALTSVVALLAFYQTLRQARALALSNQRRKEELERERDLLDGLVKERTARLAELATYLQKVREDERAHLARELHDELGSLLTAAKLDVARLKSKIASDAPELQERLRHLTETLNSGIALKRRIIEDLRPSSLSNLGLTASLEILAREFSERSELPVEIEIEDVPLVPDVQLTVYRLIQESLTNIGKYAEARKVTVTVRNVVQGVHVQVTDDGHGFDTDLERARPNAHGLAGMRHRVEAAGGALTIDASLGGGTRISAALPASRADAGTDERPLSAPQTVLIDGSGLQPAK